MNSIHVSCKKNWTVNAATETAMSRTDFVMCALFALSAACFVTSIVILWCATRAINKERKDGFAMSDISSDFDPDVMIDACELAKAGIMTKEEMIEFIDKQVIGYAKVAGAQKKRLMGRDKTLKDERSGNTTGNG